MVDISDHRWGACGIHQSISRALVKQWLFSPYVAWSYCFMQNCNSLRTVDLVFHSAPFLNFWCTHQAGMNSKSQQFNHNAWCLVWRAGGKSIDFTDINQHNFSLFLFDCLDLLPIGLDNFLKSLRASMEYFTLFSTAVWFPHASSWLGIYLLCLVFNY